MHLTTSYHRAQKTLFLPRKHYKQLFYTLCKLRRTVAIVRHIAVTMLTDVPQSCKCRKGWGKDILVFWGLKYLVPGKCTSKTQTNTTYQTGKCKCLSPLLWPIMFCITFFTKQWGEKSHNKLGQGARLETHAVTEQTGNTNYLHQTERKENMHTRVHSYHIHKQERWQKHEHWTGVYMGTGNIPFVSKCGSNKVLHAWTTPWPLPVPSDRSDWPAWSPAAGRGGA